MAYTILIVDDSEEERQRFRRTYEANGFNVMEAGDGAEGLSKAIDKKPDLIFTGIVMPKMSGFDMIDQLRKNVETEKIPIMILSHMGRKEDQIKAQEMGIKDFLTSGFITPKELVSLTLLRIEGKKGLMKYILNVDETSLDAAKLTKDFGLLPYFRCEDHPDEKKVIEIIPDENKVGEFRAKFICPGKK
ncbi:response regulator [Candidatus Giovannonibacteria bacterium]|nr:response regulator [Candidatus Giovannonibacteria bacterium]